MFDIVKNAIDKWDVYGLLELRAPKDEYDTESKMVTALIDENSSIEDIAGAISKVFSQRFTPKDFPVEKCMDIAEILYINIKK